MAFEDAQQLGLRADVHLADFVEKDRAVIGRLELADLLLRRSGERAFLMAEQLALQQRLGQGGAVETDERPLLARTGEMDRARHQLLAGAAFAPNQTGGVGAGDAGDLLLDLLHRRAFADQLALDVQLLAQRAVLGRQRHLPLHLVNDAAQLLGDGDGEFQVLAVKGLVRIGAVQMNRARARGRRRRWERR